MRSLLLTALLVGALTSLAPAQSQQNEAGLILGNSSTESWGASEQLNERKVHVSLTGTHEEAQDSRNAAGLALFIGYTPPVVPLIALPSPEVWRVF